jgi:predicted NBD/HSP70 family sugar kinase
MNRNLLLNIIRREGRLSRKQLTEISGLSVGSVSGIVAELLANHWILEIGEGDFTGGRRQTLIKLNSSAGYALGLKLMEDRVVIAVTDFESTILDYRQIPISSRSNHAQLVAELADILQEVLDTSHIAIDQIFGIGIGLAGVIHSNEGVVRHSPYFGWREVPLAQLLERQLQRPVFIENDVNTLTLTEQLFGAGRYYNDFVVMTIGRGIGLGIVVNNQLYHGAHGGAGEFGHTVILQTTNGANASGFTTLEDAAADPALIADMHRKHPELRTSLKTLSDLVELADSGNESARQAFAYSGELLGAGLANIINILNPELVIFSGEGAIAGDYRLKPMMDSLRKYTFAGLLDDMKFVVEPTNDQAWARGAASLVISKVFESPIIEAQVGN